MRKFFPVLAAAAFVMASSHAFAGTQVKASIVSPNGDPKVVTTCLGGGPKNLDGSCPNAINGSAQVSGKKGIQITLKDMTTPTAANKKELIDNSPAGGGTCDPTDASAVTCYMSIVKASANGLDVQLNLPTQIVKGKAKIKVAFSGALASPGFAGATVGLSGGETRQPPAVADQAACLGVLSGAAYAGPVASAILAGVGLTPLDLAGVFVPGIAFDGAITDNPCASGLLVGVAGVYNGN